MDQTRCEHGFYGDGCLKCQGIEPTIEPLAPTFQTELQALLHKYNKENISNTPDYLLADYIQQCLNALNNTINRRDGMMGMNISASKIEIKR
jgi:hypothetical protein